MGADHGSDDRHTAATELSDVLRQSIDELVSTEAPAATLKATLETARETLGHLKGCRRPPHQLASLDAEARGHRIHNPAAGEGNPIAPPLRVYAVDGGVEATLEVGRAYEGPPGYVHGGVTALLLDELLGSAAVEVGRYGMTARLSVTYRRPVPLRTPILFRAAVVETDGRRTKVAGTVSPLTAPHTTLVEAEGLFIQPSDDTRRAYFDGLVAADGSPAPDYHVRPSGPDDAPRTP